MIVGGLVYTAVGEQRPKQKSPDASPEGSRRIWKLPVKELKGAEG